MEQTEYLQKYEKQLRHDLVQLLRERDLLPASGPLPETPDITGRWDSMAGSFTADAMKEIAKYPLVSLGWAMYLGLAMAKYWDDGWEVYSRLPNIYEHLRDVRGFDYMDEVVRFDLYHWDCEDSVRSAAQMALDHIRHEQIPPSSALAYHVYLLSVRLLYLLGAAVGLKRLGYSMQKG